jgi:hypothetical protein
MIDGVASRPFSALTLPPIGSATDSSDKVTRVSRERYAVPRETIEDKIARWSGMEILENDDSDDDEKDVDLDDSLDGGDAKEQAEEKKKVEITMPKVNNNKQEAKINQSKPPFAKDNRYIKNNISQPVDYQKSRKDNNKKKNKPLDFKQGEKVLLADPQQKGISLQSLLPKQETRTENKLSNSSPIMPKVFNPKPLPQQINQLPVKQQNSNPQPKSFDSSPVQQQTKNVQQGRVVKFE